MPVYRHFARGEGQIWGPEEPGISGGQSSWAGQAGFECCSGKLEAHNVRLRNVKGLRTRALNDINFTLTATIATKYSCSPQQDQCH